MTTSPSGPAYRRNQLIGGIITVLASVFFWVLWFLWTTRSPSYKTGQWLAYWVVSLLLFALAGGMVFMGLRQIAVVASKARRSSADGLVKWVFNKILSNLGGEAEFGPPWPIIFDVMEFPEDTNADELRKQIKVWWQQLYDRILALLGSRISAKDLKELKCSQCARVGLTVPVLKQNRPAKELASMATAKKPSCFTYIPCIQCGSLSCVNCCIPEADKAGVKCPSCGAAITGDVAVEQAARFGSLTLSVQSVTVMETRKEGIMKAYVQAHAHLAFKESGSTSAKFVFGVKVAKRGEEWCILAAVPEFGEQ